MHTLRLIAYDGGSPPRSGSLDILLNVLDVNDNSPVFERTTYELSVSENVAPLTTVVTVRAVDRDIGENAEVRSVIHVYQCLIINYTVCGYEVYLFIL